MNQSAAHLTAITDRLARLEHAATRERRALRRWRVTALGACLATAALVGLGQATPAPDVIQARRFSLVTEEGDELGALFLGQGDAPTLRLNSPGDSTRYIGLKATPEGLAILCEWGGSNHASISVSPKGAAMGIGAAAGDMQAGMALEKNDAPVMATFDADRNLLWKSN